MRILLFLQVYAIIVSKPSKGDLSPASVSYTAGFYHIPVIGISSRDSAFSDKVRHFKTQKFSKKIFAVFPEYPCFIHANGSAL